MDAEFICRQLEKLKSDRTTLDNHCQEVAERMLPYHANFNITRTLGEKRTEKIFDSTAALALNRFNAAFTSMIVPEGMTWHGMTTTDRNLNSIPRVRDYYEQVTQILFRERYRGGFGSQIQECWTSLGAFGTTSMMVEPSKSGGLWYKSLPLYQFWIAENSEARVDMIYRCFKLTARQAYQQFGDEVPECIMSHLENSPHKEFDFVHAVMPNAEMNPRYADYRGMPYASFYICLQDKTKILSRGGYNTFPMPVSRFMTISGEPYGYSPAMTILPDNKMLNEMEKTRIKAAHLLTSPPWLLADDLMGNPISFKPDALNYGGVNSAGQQLIQPMVSGADPNIALELTDQKRKVINEAFFVTLFQILVENHTMSATEVLERAREKGALMSPAFSRQHNEFITRIIEREVDILSRAGRLPEMPPELVEAQGEYEVVYDNPLTRAQKSEPITALARTLEMMTPIAQIDQSVLVNFDFDQISRDVPEYVGLPARWIRSKEQVAAIREQQRMDVESQQLIEAAPVLAQARKTQAEAQAIAQSGQAGRV